MKRYYAPLVILSLICIPLFAVKTQSFTPEEHGIYDKGEFRGISLNMDGELSLAPTLTEIAGLSEDYVWKFVYAGNALYAVTGHGGAIYKLNAKNEFEFFTNIDTLEASAIIGAPNGDLIVAGIPRAALYRITPKGETSVIRLLPDEYVWDMTKDETGRVYIAAGGETGRIYLLEQNGTVSEFFSIAENHITCLYYDEKNRALYAGTEGRGLLLSIDRDGRHRVMYQAEEAEIHGIAKHRSGDIYFVTASRERKPSAQNAATNSQNASPLRNSIYKLDSRGAVTRMFFANNTVLLSIIADNDGILYIGAGDEGKLYSIGLDGKPALIAQLEQKQILSFFKHPNGTIYLGTGNQGRVYVLDLGYAKEGTYLSGALDAKLVSQWGQIVYTGAMPLKTQVFFETRSGNIDAPDDTWSEFERVKSNAIQSPPARFIQFRALFQTEDSAITPTINNLSLSYVPFNIAPEVFNISLLTYRKQQADKNAPKKPSLAQNEAMFFWNAYDANNDLVSFTASYRHEDETNYKALTSNSTLPYIVFDQNRAPSGYYYLRVEASDRLDNPLERALTNVAYSFPLLLDHTPPVITAMKKSVSGGQTTLRFVVEDDYSPVQTVRYSIDGGDWYFIASDDGLLDGKTESFTLPLPNGAEGIAIETIDKEGNTKYFQYVIHKITNR